MSPGHYRGGLVHRLVPPRSRRGRLGAPRAVRSDESRLAPGAPGPPQGACDHLWGGGRVESWSGHLQGPSGPSGNQHR